MPAAKRSRVCAGCGERFTALHCPNCTPSEVKQAAQQAYQRCEFVHLGEQCRFFGTVGPSTNGSGPKFCIAHFFDKTGQSAMDALQRSRDFTPYTVTDLEQDAIRKLKSGEGFIRSNSGGKPSKAWAHRLLQLHAEGHALSEIQLRFAREVLGEKK